MIKVSSSKVGKEELGEIKTSFENQWLGMGPKTKLFEEQFSKRLGLKNFIALDSCTSSLYLALKLLDLPKGSEIILPSFTWFSCATVIMLNDCVPVFCDVEVETQNISAYHITPMITERTKAIIVMHYAGKPVEMEDIKEFGIPIIEDAAHAVDSKIEGKYCGGIGDLGIYSFDEVKNLAVGKMGGLTVQDEKLSKQGRNLRYCGVIKSGLDASSTKDRWWEYDVVDFMYKMIPDDVSASIGLAQLKKLDVLQKRRKYIWNIYQKEFSDLSWLQIPEEAKENEQHSYFTYFIRLRNNRRDELAKFLYDNGIYTTLRYHPLHMVPIYNSTGWNLPNSKLLNDIGLNIPLHPDLSDKDIDYIVTKIKQFGRRNLIKIFPI